MIVFHGTSIQNARKIIKEGFRPSKPNWKVSNKLAYFYNHTTHNESFRVALLQGGPSAFKYVTECRRCVLAVEVKADDISPDETNTAGAYAFQYDGKVLGPNSIVGAWHDTHNLQALRPFMLYNSRHLIHRTNTPKLIDDIQDFFGPPRNPVSVPIVEMFSKTQLGFDPTKERYLI